MKTEKRLTMALSVLVALMMLAVPLASSSNLFVDGGQTNSNGDAPSLGAASYRVDFILNEGSEGRISLDEVVLDTSKFGNLDGVAWYQDENDNLFAVVNSSEDVTIQQLIWALTNVVDNSDASKSVFNITKIGYILDSFVNNDTKAAFGPDKTNITAPTTGDKITKNMTLTATWLLDDSKYAEIPVDVVYEGETKEYVKAFPKFKGTYADDTVIDEKNVYVTAGNTFIANGIDKIDTYGIVVNAKNNDLIKPAIDEVYTFKTTYGEDKEIAKDAKDLKIPVTSKLTVTYTFDEKNFSKIVVSSIAFKDGKDVTLYADKIRSYTYSQVYTALTTAFDDLSKPSEMTKSPIGDLPILDLKDKEKFITVDGYKLTGWNEGAQLLKSENNASSPLTLDAELNGYYVIFMSKGQSEYVYVPFGELSAEKTTLDVAGVNHWVYITYDDYIKTITKDVIKPFNFASTTDVEKVETTDGTKKPTAVLIACFTPSSSTAYAVFDANTYKENREVDVSGNFGNEYITKIIIPGKTGSIIPLPSINPAYNDEESRTVFLGWDDGVTEETKPSDATNSPTPTMLTLGAEYNSSTSKYKTTSGEVTTYNAVPISYVYKITFYDGDKVVGIFYYSAAVTTDINSALVAFEVDGKVYKATRDSTSNDLKLSDAAQKAYDSIIVPDKAGYYITQWNDANKNKVITIENGAVTKVDIKDMKDDLNLYAQFEPESYVIQYLNTYGSGFSSQDAKVDQTVTLYTGATFVYNGYKLVGWSDRPDGEGNKYDLGASFTLNGEQYKDLKDGTLTMYAVWEKSGSTSGDNNEGNDGNNTDTYLLAGILAVIIILIILIAFLMRRKQ